MRLRYWRKRGVYCSSVVPTRFGEESLRYALLMLCPGYLWSSWHLWRASQTVTGDLEAAGLRETDFFDKARLS